MKKHFILAAIAAALCVTTSCTNDPLSCDQSQELTNGKAHVRLVCSTAPEVTTRASLTANGKALTDIYIMDYDKQSGKLLQVLHQTSTATDFAEPDLTLDYGQHTLKVIATRSTSPTLLTASSTAWDHTANVLTPVSATTPVVLSSDKTSDTFGATKDVTVNIGQATTVAIELQRMVAKLVINSTDEFPSDCSTITLDLNEHKGFSFQTFDVIASVGNQRVSDVSSLAGTTGTVLSYFVLAPTDGYTTDITFTTGKKNSSTPYATITVPNVPIDRNKVTTITGSFYNHQQGFSLSVNDAWEEEGNNIAI